MDLKDLPPIGNCVLLLLLPPAPAAMLVTPPAPELPNLCIPWLFPCPVPPAELVTKEVL